MKLEQVINNLLARERLLKQRIKTFVEKGHNWKAKETSNKLNELQRCLHYLMKIENIL